MVADDVRRRVGRLAAATLAALLVASGCADTQEEPVEPTSQQAPRPDVTFDVDVSPGPDAIAVSWSLTNTGDAPLLVVDGPPRASGASVVYDPGTTYVVGEGDGTVQVAQRLFALPETDQASFAQLPRAGATELAPGATLEREPEVPVPLARLSPWGDDLGSGPIELPAPVTSVQFCLGVLAGEPQPSWGPGRDGDVVVLNHGSEAVAAQHVLCSDPIPLD